MEEQRMTGEQVEFQRDCQAVAIPAGQAVTLPAGTVAFITQSLGGSYTLQVPSFGGLFRVDGRDADAIGKPPTGIDTSAPADGDTEANVWAALKTCFDPEIPVNIVDLGLIYDMQIRAGEGEGSRVDIKMTLTAPGCGMGTYIAADARDKILALPGVEDADVQVVWDPPWSPHMISPEGREKLGMD